MNEHSTNLAHMFFSKTVLSYAILFVLLLLLVFVLSVLFIKVADKFAAAFGLQPVLVKLFHGFWCLDHKDFDVCRKFIFICFHEIIDFIFTENNLLFTYNI